MGAVQRADARLQAFLFFARHLNFLERQTFGCTQFGQPHYTLAHNPCRLLLAGFYNFFWSRLSTLAVCLLLQHLILKGPHWRLLTSWLRHYLLFKVYLVILDLSFTLGIALCRLPSQLEVT